MLSACPECSTERTKGKKGLAKFCTDCGYHFEDATSPQHAAPTELNQPVTNTSSSAMNGAGEISTSELDEVSDDSPTLPSSRSKENAVISQNVDEPPLKMSKLKITADGAHRDDTDDVGFGATAGASSSEQGHFAVDRFDGRDPMGEAYDDERLTHGRVTDFLRQNTNPGVNGQMMFTDAGGVQGAQINNTYVLGNMADLMNSPYLQNLQLNEEQMATILSGQACRPPSKQERFLKDCPPKQLSESVYFEEACDYIPSHRRYSFVVHQQPNLRRHKSLPSLLPSAVADTCPTESAADMGYEADGWDSDEEDWFNQDVSKADSSDDKHVSETPADASATAAMDVGGAKDIDPMETEEHQESSQTEQGAATASENAVSSDTPAASDDPAEEVLRIFIQYKENIDKLVQPSCYSKLNASDNATISRLSTECIKKLEAYNQRSKNDRTGDDGTQSSLSEHQKTVLKGMENFVNQNAMSLNQLATKGGLKMIATTSVSLIKKEKPRTCRKMTFMAVLSKPFMEFFEKRGGTEPVVEIRSDTTKWTQTLVTLHKNEQNVWVGEWSAPLTLPTSVMDYKYVVHDGVRITRDNWEWLHRSSTKKHRSIIIGGSGPDQKVFDGIVLSSNRSEIWKSYEVDQPPSKHGGLSLADNSEYCQGVRGMFPNWVEEVERGTSIWSLSTWIENVRSQQLDLLTGFASSDNSKLFSARRAIDQVLGVYVGECVKEQLAQLDRASDTWQIISSMIGLFHITNCRYDNRISLIEQYQELFISLIKSTMDMAADLSAQSKRPLNVDTLINDMVQSDGEFRRTLRQSLVSAVEIITKRLIKDSAWIALLPFMHLLVEPESAEGQPPVSGRKGPGKGKSQQRKTPAGSTSFGLPHGATLETFGGLRRGFLFGDPTHEDERMKPADNYHQASWWGLADVEKAVTQLSHHHLTADVWRMWLGWLQPWFRYDPKLSYSFIYLLNEKQFITLLNSDEAHVHALPLNAVIARVKRFNGKDVKIYQGLLKFMKVVLQRGKALDHESVQICGSFLSMLVNYYNGTVAAQGLYEILQIYILSVRAFYNAQKEQRKKTEKSSSRQAAPKKGAKEKDKKNAEPDFVAMETLMEPLHHFLENFNSLLQRSSWYAVNLGNIYHRQQFTDFYSRYDRDTKVREDEVQIWTHLFKCDARGTELQIWWDSSLSTCFKERLSKVANAEPMEIVDLYCNQMFEIPVMDQFVAQVTFMRAEQLLLDEKKARNLFRGKFKDKIGKLVDQAFQKSWNNKDESDITILRSMVKWGNFLPVWNFYLQLSEDQRSSITERSRDRLFKSKRALETIFTNLLKGTISFADFVFLHENNRKVLDLCAVSQELLNNKGKIERAIIQREEERQLFIQFHSQVSSLWQFCASAVEDSSLIDDWLRRNVDVLRFVDTVSRDKQVICPLIPPEIRKILDEFQRMKERVVFHRAFDLYVREATKTPFAGVAKIFTRAIDTYQDVCDLFNSGSISIAEFEMYHKAYFNSNLQLLLSELPHMVREDILSTRKEQVELSAVVDNCHRGAMIMLDMRKLFSLTGDFSDMDHVLESRDKKLELRKISHHLLRSASRVKNITTAQRTCLEAFKQCTDFVKWVIQEVPKKDISNFVDLASSTLGEDDLAAQKTRYLLNALTGYAPLIYYNFEEESTSFDQFLGLCNQVWVTMKENPELERNLTNSAGQLEWLKKVKSHYGQTEITSIAQATAINETGVYRVGNIPKFSKDFKSLEDVIALRCTVEEKDKEETQRTYTYSELKELQSKLTLVAGDKQKQNKDTIRRFDEMKDAIENLARAYLEIRREGCIQFDQMYIEVDCNEHAMTAVKFKFRSVKRVFKGGSRDGSALAHCHVLYDYMMDCVQKWQSNMGRKRKEYAELNFYTTEQIVVLRRELAHFLAGLVGDTLKQSLPLLAMIHPVQPEELLHIIKSYAPKTDKIESMDVEENTPRVELSPEQLDMVEELAMENEDLPKDLIAKAVNQLESSNHADYVELVRKMQLTADQPRSQVQLMTSDDLLMNLTERSGDRSQTLLEQLTELWDGFVTETGKTIKNFLSIEHLGFVLNQLMKATGTVERPRTMPFYMERGRPHLIAVPHRLKYQLVLSLYAFDKKFTYPTRNEVFICTSVTRREQVVLFLKRALQDPLSFYCMVNCHLLDYDICREIEHMISTADETNNVPYGLAFVYTEEVKDARIRAYLDKYLVKNSEVAPIKKLRAYVTKILTAPRSLRTAACSTDPNRSMARLIRSRRAGVGKSLQKDNLCRRLRMDLGVNGKDITIPVYKLIDTDSVIARLTEELGNGSGSKACSTIHFDIAHEVESGVDELLFNLIILRSIVNSEGVVWQAQPTQYYIIESMPHTNKDRSSIHEVLDLLPSISCITPEKALKEYTEGVAPGSFIGFDETVLHSREWQTVLKFLNSHLDKDPANNYWINENEPFSSPIEALRLLIQHCGLKDPSWSELRHYVYFLSNQLFKVNKSPYCAESSAEDLPGFRRFVVQFMFRMAEDFATRSLKIAEETPGVALNEVVEEDDGGRMLDQLGMKRTWESGNHPYLFFNEDGETITPLGFFVKSINIARPFSLVDCESQEELLSECITRELKRALDQSELSLTENFKSLKRSDQVSKLRDVMVKQVMLYRTCRRPDNSVIQNPIPYFNRNDDPDPDYVLTMDNAKKILAIHQRLRVNIPVIIMGETGCGKTKLIEFMSKLQVPTPLKEKINTMVTVKVHGGTTEDDIIKKVNEAQILARRNQEVCEEYIKSLDSTQVPSVYTILFLDEANTTEAIGLVKEILCDGRMRGKSLDAECGLKIVAACNPYRRHTPSMIEKLKKAGLGYSVSEEKTTDKFGQIPMRHLVYRVQPLSQSLLPLVWDFGTLRSPATTADDHGPRSGNIEAAYITKMLVKWNQDHRDNDGLNFRHMTGRIVMLLSLTQAFMREQKDECSFVSLRDIQRLLEVSNWFYTHKEHIFPAMEELEKSRANPLDINVPQDGDVNPAGPANVGVEGVVPPRKPSAEARSLILGLGVCYLARLEEATRRRYAETIREGVQDLVGSGHQVAGDVFFLQQLELCQDLFVNNVVDEEHHKNIAKNKALKENVFMMIVCIENRIPLFLVGKPGSSKSLSKAMVVDAMKGAASKADLFKYMKRAYMVSFQCSRHATPAGIVGVFNHCAKFQKEQDLDAFVSVVVLDEVGLAEDSENMPLKTLHPLLEDGCEGNKTPEPYMKCAFVGISNWALDPAKMNRGILVQRGTPDDAELADIAAEICQTGRAGGRSPVQPEFIGQLARGYLDICQKQKPEKRDLTEFFGLRDFYSLMKMVVNFAVSTGRLNRNQLEHSIRRNFGGFDSEQFDPMQVFKEHCPTIERLFDSEDGRPPTDSMGLIQSSLSGCDTALDGMESRYLLILTENLSVLSIILDEFASHDQQPEVVFGSRFRDDVSYTQICHNIYRIKTCMDMGRPVILLNLDDLYESLYDALNQYFSTWGDKKFVDLGLGTHRVKAFVHDQFRLVVIADKNKVHSQFPIPLINRLEKHYISATSLLNANQRQVKKKLEEWAEAFVTPRRQYQMNTCPLLCDGCEAPLDQPYKLPCLQHFVGECCREAMFRGDIENECPVDHQEISPEFDWEIDKAALENRQYFENAKPATVFIGYSSETTALAVREASEDLAAQALMDEDDEEQLLDKMLKRAQHHLLQIATGESVLRLDRTHLSGEAKRIEQIYMQEQQHENLYQYLTQHMSNIDSSKSSFLQVTSFAELMVDKDVETLKNNLKVSGHPTEVCSLFLKDFVKEDKFTETVRQFYEKPLNSTNPKLMMVQCETANENVELLDSVRYIIQRESEAAETPTHTVLLLTLPRGFTFSGYQGGKWKCVHIDDPRSPVIRLPSLSKCLQLTPSRILENLLRQLRISSTPQQELMDSDDMPGGDDLLEFVLQCLPVTVSVIKAEHMYDRVALLKTLFRSLDGSHFSEVFLGHVHKLLSAQDQYAPQHWVKADAAKASNMKHSETLRHSLEDSLERAFVPALAAVISFVDVRQNLHLMNSNSPLQYLWMQIFTNCDKLGLSFEQVTKHNDSASSKLPRSYRILDVGDGHQQFRVQFPFSWIVKHTIDGLLRASEQAGDSPESSADALVEQFENMSVIGQVIQAVVSSKAAINEQILQAYLNDFVYMTYPCANTTEHKIVMDTITKYLIDQGFSRISLVHMHLVYDKLGPVMRNLPVVFNLIINHGGDLISTVYTSTVKKAPNGATCDVVALTCLLSHIKGLNARHLVSDPEAFVKQVDECKPVAKQVFDSATCEEAIKDCRNLWTLLELKKLYVEHVIMPTPVDISTGRRKNYKLANFVRNVTLANFQTEAAFMQVVNSLQETVKEGIRSLYANCPSRCPLCSSSLDAPVHLPCKHFLCEVCAAELKICSQQNCGRAIPLDCAYNPSSDNISEEAMTEFTWLRDRLNKFFMCFVSEMVFVAEPEPAILTWLVDRITFRAGTRQFGLFNKSDIVDPNPVMRSFLLKLLLRCEQSANVLRYLSNMIGKWQRDSMESRVQTMVLLMDCYKDFNEHPQESQHLTQSLKDNTELVAMRVAQPTVEILKELSDLQNVLVQSVELLTSPTHYESSAYRGLEAQLNIFLQHAQASGNQQPGYMVARQLLNTAGESFLKDLLNTSQNYLVHNDIRASLESFTVPDALAIYGGQVYIKAKRDLEPVIANANNPTQIFVAIAEFQKRCVGDENMLLQVLFTRVTRSFGQTVRIPDNVCQALYQHLSMNVVMHANTKLLLKMLLTQGALPREMDVSQSKGINLSMLILNMYSCMSGDRAMGDLNPLSEIVNQPQRAATHFLPTMADNQFEIYQESIRKALQTANENPVAYRCPNGHPYVIGNCGRPYTTARCHECGAQIGGQAHQAHAGNQTLGDNDSAARSRKGHILGRQTSRSGAAPERELSALSCAVLRCLTHLCMFTGSLFHLSQVFDMIQPALVRNEDVQPFLEAHIQLDLQHIAKCCAQSTDDCLLLLHDVIIRMKNESRGSTGGVVLTNIEERKSWEKQFDTTYIKPIFDHSGQQIERHKTSVQTAKQNSMKETLSTTLQPLHEQNIIASPGLWSYRRPLTLPAIQNLLHSTISSCPNLTCLADNCISLTAVGHLPNILHLLRVVSDAFHSKFSRAEADETSLGQFCEEQVHLIDNIHTLVESFIEAWNIMIECSMGAAVNFAELSMDSDLARIVFDQQASRRGTTTGVAASAPIQLVRFLVESHNKVLSFVEDESKPAIPLVSVNSGNVICLTSKQELLDLILAHSEYELKETTTSSYNWPAIEREVIQRYISNKSKINFTKEQLPCFVYQEDFNLHNQMQALSDTQVRLDTDHQDHIANSLPGRVPMLTVCLKELKVVINFLSVMGHIERDNSLAEYMESTFGREPGYLSKDIQLKHVKHVWLIVKYAQTDLLMRQFQEPFDDLGGEYRVALTEYVTAELSEYCRYNSQRTKTFIHLLFEYIVLGLNKAAVDQDPEDGNKSLLESLKEYLMKSSSEDDDMVVYALIGELPPLPDELKVRHAAKAWSYAWTRFTTPTI